MRRADVHYALAIDSELWDASQVDPTLLDPVVRVDALPGSTHPLTVLRDYQGPQGLYLEHFTVTDATGRELYRSRQRRIQLRGEQFEDRQVTRLPRLYLERGDEHTLTLFLDDREIASVPVFVELGGGGDPAVAARETFAKALGKGNVAWLVVPHDGNGDGRRRGKAPRRGLVYEERHQPVWFVYDADKVYVFSGPTEQEVAGLDSAETVEIVARSKDLRSRVSRVPATVRAVPGDDPLFDRIGQAGLGRRLNLPDGEGALARWRDTCTLYELTPDFAATMGRSAGQGGPGAGAASSAATPAEEEAPQAAKASRPEDAIHVEAQIDQAVFDRLVAEGTSERVARAKAKAAHVRAEKKRILAERKG